MKANLCGPAVAFCMAWMLAAETAQSQSIYGLSASGGAFEWTGPGDPTCGYPDGPVLSSFPVGVPGPPCAGLGPIAAPPAITGDIAVDKTTDTIWVANARRIAHFTSAGSLITAVSSPLTGLTGMCFVKGVLSDTLWLTDGATILSIPAPSSGCPGTPAPTSSFSAPVGPGMFLGAITDLDWDPSLSAFIACDASGTIGSFGIGGSPGPLPFVTVPPSCSMVRPLTGIAIDDNLVGSGTVYVTDGSTVAYMLVTSPAVLAPPTFYTPVPCYPSPARSIVGLAFASRPLTYGAPSGVPSTVSTVGQPYAGDPFFSITIDAPPGSATALYYGVGGPLCPPLPLGGGLTLHISPPLLLFGSAPVPLSGTATLSYSFPSTSPIGFPFDLQFVILTPAPALGLSSALHLTVPVP